MALLTAMLPLGVIGLVDKYARYWSIHVTCVFIKKLLVWNQTKGAAPWVVVFTALKP